LNSNVWLSAQNKHKTYTEAMTTR